MPKGSEPFHQTMSEPAPSQGTISTSSSSSSISRLTLLKDSSIPPEFDLAAFNREMKEEMPTIKAPDSENISGRKSQYRHILFLARDSTATRLIDHDLNMKDFVEEHYGDLCHIMDECLEKSDFTKLLLIGERTLLCLIRGVLWEP